MPGLEYNSGQDRQRCLHWETLTVGVHKHIFTPRIKCPHGATSGNLSELFFKTVALP